MAVTITNGYCTLAQLRTSLGFKTADTGSNDALSDAINAASRAIDEFTGRFFYADGTTQVPVVRYFTPHAERTIFVDDFVSLTEVATDYGYAQQWGTVWATTDYMVEPINNPRLGKPYDRLVAVGRYIFAKKFPQSVKITGVWGWSAVPEVVRQACMIQASRFYNRSASPFGIAGSADLGTVRLSARLDPDVQVLLSGVTRNESALY